MQKIIVPFVTIFFWLTTVPLTIFLGLIALFFSLFDRSGNSLQIIAIIWSRLLTCLAFTSVKVHNYVLMKNQPHPFLIMTNHSGFFDIFAFLGFIWRQYRMISKEENFKIPVLGPAMKKAGYISINAANPKKSARGLQDSIRTIQNGTSVMIYPEGSRSEDGVLRPFRRGAFRLAKEAGVPIIVAYIDGAYKIIPPFQKFPIPLVRPGRMSIEFLELISADKVKEMNEKELSDYVFAVMKKRDVLSHPGNN